MRQPREGEVLWARVPGGRASHAVTHDSWPAAVCGLNPERWQKWHDTLTQPVWLFDRRNHGHSECVRRSPCYRRINFWSTDGDEADRLPGYPVI